MVGSAAAYAITKTDRKGGNFRTMVFRWGEFLEK
jgi:hypothetical protein